MESIVFLKLRELCEDELSLLTGTNISFSKLKMIVIIFINWYLFSLLFIP